MYVPLEGLIGRTEDSVYKLAILAGRRAIELAEGSPAAVSNKSAEPLRPVSLALKEIAEGKVTCKSIKQP